MCALRFDLDPLVQALVEPLKQVFTFEHYLAGIAWNGLIFIVKERKPCVVSEG